MSEPSPVRILAWALVMLAVLAHFATQSPRDRSSASTDLANTPSPAEDDQQVERLMDEIVEDSEFCPSLETVADRH